MRSCEKLQFIADDKMLGAISGGPGLGGAHGATLHRVKGQGEEKSGLGMATPATFLQ